MKNVQYFLNHRKKIENGREERRNRLWKQVLSVTLAATMVFSLPSQAVFAENNSTDIVSGGDSNPLN